MAKPDGLQLTGDPIASAHHFSNTTYNVLRGGVVDMLPPGRFDRVVVATDGGGAREATLAALLRDRRAAEPLDGLHTDEADG